MATIVENKKGFRVIKTSNTECIEWGGAAVCDHCNGTASFGYLVSVLNHWICPECFKDWYNRAKRYTDDIPYEEKKFEYFSIVLDIEGVETLTE